MDAELDWRDDALVRIEKRLFPLPARLLRRHLPDGSPDPALPADLRASAAVLRDGQARYFDRYGIVLGEEARQALDAMAARLDDLAEGLRETGAPGPPLTEIDAFEAALDGFMDVLRSAFLGVVLTRQAEASMRSAAAAREVASISRQIYFIAINVSVEAARIGSAGAGVAVIGDRIRELSREATAALGRLGSGEAGVE